MQWKTILLQVWLCEILHEVCNLNANYPLILLKALIVLTCLYKLQAIPVECTKQKIFETS